MHMPSYKLWKEEGEKNDWKMPNAPLWKRLPIIRRIRAAIISHRMERHYAQWRAVGAVFRQPYDDWALWGIAHGFERPKGDADKELAA